MKPRCVFCWLILLTATVSTPSRLRADETDETWPQWRGPHRNGMAQGVAWPESLQSPWLVEAWHRELPPSFSGPIVSASTVYVTFTRNEETEGVVALDRERGTERWQTEWPGTMQVADLGTSMGSWIRATPAYDGRHVFVAGMPDLLVCLDAQSGQSVWQADFHARYGTPLPELGFVSSPLVIDQGVYVQAADSFIRVDKRTGETVWRCLERKDVGQGSYSSPDFAVIAGQPQLLVANIPSIAGVDPATGAVLWQRELDSYDQGCILAPIAFDHGIFTSTRASRTGYYPLTVQDGRFTISDGWKSKLVVYMSSPIVTDNHAYLHLKNGRFACIDLRTGAEKWISDRTFGTYCSMICRGDRILALTNEGQLLLLQATPTAFTLFDSRTVSSEETWGHLALAGNMLYVRAKQSLTAYRWSAPDNVSSP